MATRLTTLALFLAAPALAAPKVSDSDAPSVPSAYVAPMPSSTKSPKPGPPPHLYSAAASPADGSADAAALKLYQRLRKHYGKKIYSGHTRLTLVALRAAAGGTPVVRGFDMINYSPRNPHGDWKPLEDGSVKEAIDWFNATKGKGIVSFHWHWFSPSGGNLGKPTYAAGETSFDISKAVVPGTQEYKDTLRDIDAIAVQLKRLRDAGVPVLWRPLHEASGGYFWWSAHGPGPCKALYDIMFDRLTNLHGLHNLLWVWSSPDPDWYPGNSKVDVVGYDSYPGPFVYDAQKAKFDALYDMTGGQKLVALTETGPIPDIDALFANDARWSYFLTWETHATDDNSPEHLKAVYAHPAVVTIERN